MSNYLEQQLFSWEGWDELETAVLQFSNCTLKVDVGEHLVGSKFDFIVFDMQSSKLALYMTTNNEDAENNLDEVGVYELKISVGDRL
jgi:hypothetical protein